VTPLRVEYGFTMTVILIVATDDDEVMLRDRKVKTGLLQGFIHGSGTFDRIADTVEIAEIKSGF
jgi:hypothetical protein